MTRATSTYYDCNHLVSLLLFQEQSQQNTRYRHEIEMHTAKMPAAATHLVDTDTS